LLAWEVLRSANGAPGVLNAANEIAVESFLSKKIKFTQIHEVNLRTLDKYLPGSAKSLDDLLALDLGARDVARQVVEELSSSR